ncbi:MAG: hypothetical protein K8R67_06920 [Desulfobacteraceae bacterium]|nr:hypothetical protein [Desulfobacteraceae bacterium]
MEKLCFIFKFFIKDSAIGKINTDKTYNDHTKTEPKNKRIAWSACHKEDH